MLQAALTFILVNVARFPYKSLMVAMLETYKFAQCTNCSIQISDGSCCRCERSKTSC